MMVEFKIPFVMVFFSPGVGEGTVPTYEDRRSAKRWRQQIIAAAAS